MKKKTKIVATIGPSTESMETLKEIFKEGVDLARLNTKHSSIEWHQKTAEKIEKTSKSVKKRVAIIVDLQGPEIRINAFENGPLKIKKGDRLFFSSKESKKTDIVIENKEVVKSFKKNQEFSIDDGKFIFKVKNIKGNGFAAESFSEGKLESRKSVNVPFLDVPIPSLKPKDLRFMKALADKLDYLALSFVRNKKDVLALRKEIEKINPAIGIISKIEKPEAIENIDEILEASDGLMVARGDLAIEAGFEKIPGLQKKLILKSRQKGKPVIVATEMLESMIENQNPTRAEVNDVANAVFEAADSVMLSGETAIGKNPVKAVKMMTKIIKEAEKSETHSPPPFPERKLELDEESVIKLAAILPQLIKKETMPQGFLVFTKSGQTSFSLSSFRSEVPIFAFTDNETIRDRLLLSYNTIPFEMTFKGQKRVEETIKKAVSKLKKESGIKKGDKLIVVSGDDIGVRGSTNNIRVTEV